MNKWYVTCCMMAVLAGCGASERHEDADGQERIVYHLLWNARGFSHCQILVNGVPAVVRREGEPYHTGRSTLNWFMHNGANDIRIEAGGPQPEGGFSVELYATPVRIEFDQGQLLYKFSAGTTAHTVNERVSITASIPRAWAWQSAERTQTLSSDDRQAILALVEQLQAAYVEKDVGKVEKLCAAAREVYDSIYTDSKAVRRSTRDVMERVFASRGYTVVPLNRDEVALTSYGQLVRAENNKGRDLIESITASQSDADSVAFNISVPYLLFMKQDGVWVIAGHGV